MVERFYMLSHHFLVDLDVVDALPNDIQTSATIQSQCENVFAHVLVKYRHSLILWQG